MNRKSTVKYSLAAIIFAFAIAGQAHAAAFTLNLTGTVAPTSTYSFVSGTTQYDGFVFSLTGLDGSTALTLSEGDTVTANIVFDPSGVTIPPPGAGGITFFEFDLEGSSFPAIDTGTANDTTQFYTGGLSGTPGLFMSGSSCTTSGRIADCSVFGSTTPLTFDSLTTSFTVDVLQGQSVTVDASQLIFTNQTPIAAPEPTTSAMLLAGLGLLGFVARRRMQA